MFFEILFLLLFPLNLQSMKKLLVLLFLTICTFGFTQNQMKSSGFIENKGQIIDQNGKPNEAVKYLLNTNGLNVQLRKNGFSYDVYETKKIPLTQKEKKISRTTFPTEKDSLANQRSEYSYHRIDIDFVNSNTNAKFVTEGKSSDYDNYYNVVSKPEGILNVYKFQKVTYQNIYPNIDVVFFVPEDKSKPVEYNFVIKPNGKINDIQLKFTGAKTALVDNKIKMNVRFGTMEETIPLSWTENDKKTIAISYKKISKNTYGFQSSENLDNKTIIIDPVPIRLWGTYYGGSYGDGADAINIDSNNDVIVSGATASSNNIASAGPNTSGYTSGGSYIAKFNPNGNLLWSSYYPFQTGNLTLDSNNNMYLYGNVFDANNQIPSPGCFQPIKDIYNSGFLIKLNNLGAKVWGTYYGGNQNDYIKGVCIDNNSNVYVVGATNSTNAFSTPGAFLTVKPSIGDYQTGFIAKFDANGNRIWGTFYGGELADGFFDCSISDDGYLYAVGTHNSQNNITTPGAYQTTAPPGSGGMIIKFDLNGNRIWGTFIIDQSYTFRGRLKGDNIYLSGRVFSNGIGTPGTMSENMLPLPSGSILSGTENNFISKFNVQTQQYVWGTYFFEQIIGLDVDAFDNVYFSGYTGINNGITTPDAYMPVKTAYQKSYLIKLNPIGQKIWGTYYGGNFAEQLGNVRIDQNNDIYLFGNTNGSTTGIATANAHQTTLGSNPDAYLVKFRDCQSSSLANSNSPICVGEDLNLTASGGTNYSWTGPNGFTSTLQNPTIITANATHSGQYTCAVAGTGGCDNTITIDVIVGDVTKPIPDILNLPNINGDCTTAIPIPTATDNCSGIVNGTTTNPLDYPLPGSYNFVWTFTDANGNSETQNQTVIISPVVLPTVNSPQTFCIQQNASINDIVITGQNIQWYDAPTGGNLLNSTTVLQNGVTYYASQTLNSCESSRVPVAINIQNTPAPIGNSPQSFCASQSPTLNDIVVSGTNINWYSANTSTTVLPSNTVLVDGTTYYATQTVNGCESVNRFPITISLIYSLNAINYDAFLCDIGNDGSQLLDLSLYNDEIASLAGNAFSYYSTFNGAENLINTEQLATNHLVPLGQSTVYVRIDNVNGCHQIVELELTLVSIPIITMPDEFAFCEGSSVTISAPSGFDLNIWSTNVNAPSITVNQAGNYWLMVGNSYGNATCTSTKNFTVVLSNAPTITSIDTVDWTDTENSITVNTIGLGDYEYSVDGINFQNSNIFNGLPNGAYSVIVRDKNGCGRDTKQVFLLNYPKFFTPNGDGNNDGWSIKFSQFEPNFEVQIFDRYGKLLRVMKNNEAWDGNYNGRQLPSDDYWFTVTRNDGRIHKGHFAMKR